jgi:PAS domain S-box/diguanylate cyclase (GGDEF) domain
MVNELDMVSWEWETDANLRYLTPPDRKAQALGLENEELLGKFMFDFMNPSDIDKMKGALYADDGSPRAFVNLVGRYPRRDRSLVILETSGTPICDKHGECLGFRGIERAIAGIGFHSNGSQEPQLETVYATAPIALCVVGRDGRLLAVNERHTILAGKPISSLVGVKVSELHPESGEKIPMDFRLLDAGGTVPDHEVQINGRHYAIAVTPLPDAAGNIGAICVAHFDITERKRLELELDAANRRLADLAIRDHLTGSFNRRHFDETLTNEVARLSRHRSNLSVALVDVDCFKRYNDIYGHVAGDDCLISIVDAMSKTLHRPGDNVYRYGGEEFAVILQDTDSDGAIVIVERLRKAVEDLNLPHSGNSHERVTISIGVTSIASDLHCDGKIPSNMEVLEEADQALYAAKENGRNRAVSAGH